MEEKDKCQGVMALSKLLDDRFTPEQIVMAGKLRDLNQEKLKNLIEKEDKLALYIKDECKGVILSYPLYKQLANLFRKLEEEAETRWILREFGEQLVDPKAKYHTKPEGMSHKEFIEKMMGDE